MHNFYNCLLKPSCYTVTRKKFKMNQPMLFNIIFVHRPIICIYNGRLEIEENIIELFEI